MIPLLAFRRTFVLVTLASFGGAALSQPQTLNLDFQNVYLSDVSRNLVGLDSYRQRYTTTTERTVEGQVQATSYEWLNEVNASGDRHGREVSQGGFLDSVTAHYLVDGRAFFYGASDGEAFCQEVEAFEPTEPSITVSDVTGFQTATLVAAGETVNGIPSDRYRLEPPAFNNYYDVESLAGELWIAQDGGAIVRYEIQASDGEALQRWAYELQEVGGPLPIELPVECIAG